MLLLAWLGMSITQIFAQQQDRHTTFDDYSQVLSNQAIEAAKLVANKEIELTNAQAKEAILSMKGKKVQLNKGAVAKKVLTDAQIAQKLKASTVVFGVAFDCGHCPETHIDAASGYVIDGSGVVVTNYHVVKSFASFARKNLIMTVQTAAGKIYPVTAILASNEEDDLCIVRVHTQGQDLPSLTLGAGTEQGDAVYVMGHPFRHFYYFSKGIVARNFYDFIDEDKMIKRPQMEITADYAGGSSGGPVVDSRGRIVGTVSSTKSIYYNPTEQKNLQMVIKVTKPVSCLLEMIEFL